MDLNMLGRILMSGLMLGGSYALLAVGFSLIFGVAKIFNLAHTVLYMVTAYLIFIGTFLAKLNYLICALPAITFTCILGMLIYKLLIDRVKAHEITVTIICIAVAIFFQEVILMTFGGDYQGIPPLIMGYVDILGVSVLYQHLLVILGCIVTLFLLLILLTKTSLGKAIRAIAQDREAANLMGINVSQICLITMGISTGLTAIAALLSASLEPLHYSMWMQPLIVVLAAVVLGGLGSIKGSILGAFILGFAETSVVNLIPKGSFLRGSISLTVMIVVLFFKPEGIFGVVFEEERL